MGSPVADKAETKAETSGLAPVEVEAINLFIQFSRALGQPRSYAEIYGLLFICERPLSMDELIERLALSRGSASQGLKFLEDLGAIRAVYLPGERRTHYEAVAELRNMAGRFLSQQVLPHFHGSTARLDQIGAQISKLPAERRKHVQARVKLLRSWVQNGRRVIPIALKVLGAGT
jgi:DNA-binding transcriptional regulator GbsR (MarR family)